MLDTTTLNHIYDNNLTNKVQRAVDNGKLQLFATDVQKQEIAGIRNDEKRKQGLKHAVEEMRVEFIETSDMVVALDLDQESRRGFRGSKVGSRIPSDEDVPLLKRLVRENKINPLKKRGDISTFYTAVKENMDYLVTENTADFKGLLEIFKIERDTILQIKNHTKFEELL